jgi:hypothetical protein
MLLFNYFAHPGKGSYMVVMVKPASILIQQKIIVDSVVNIWFKEKKDLNVSLIKVKPTSAYFGTLMAIK